ASTLDLLCFVARRNRDARLLLLGAYRPGEAERRVAFGQAVAELNRLRMLGVINVGPLTVNEVAALAEGYLAAQIAPEASFELFPHSEGNPFFAEELLRNWIEIGALTQSERSWTLANAARPTLPPSLVAAVRQRLSRLPPDVVELLRAAAIVGRTFDVALLA